MRFVDRRHAGRLLANLVADARPENPVVLALPRGGVPVGFEVSQALHCPLDVLVVKKVGVPGQPELAMGAVGEDDATIVHRRVVAAVGVSDADLEVSIGQARMDLEEAVRRYRPEKPPEEIEDRTAVIVDDGLATGSSARAAVEVARARGAGAVWLVVPVAPASTVAEMAGLVDQLVIFQQPRRFIAVGNWYQDFRQTTDSEVVSMLREGG